MILEIVKFGHPVLRQKGARIESITPEIKQLIADMLETMHAAPGIGLAATQVNVHRRLIVMDLSEQRNEPRVFVNPEILTREGAEVSEEGCLSVPQVFEDVERAARVRVRSQNLKGEVIEEDLDGLLAICLQHELDHLEGKLFVDYLSSLKRERIRRKLEKERRERTTAPRARANARVI